jgi:hypothetical protein
MGLAWDPKTAQHRQQAWPVQSHDPRPGVGARVGVALATGRCGEHVERALGQARHIRCSSARENMRREQGDGLRLRSRCRSSVALLCS